MKLSLKSKLGFASASLADGLCYVLFYSFFLIYMTDYAGVNPAWAGSISLIVVLWDAITDPIMGYISDHFKSSKGRRRPFILYGILPWVVSVILMFLNVSFGDTGKFVYYLFMALLFWTAYTICLVPYNALGAELTDDYAERASLRLYAQIFSSAGTTIAGTFTLLLVAMIAKAMGCDDRTAWFYVAIVFALVSMLALFITWKSLEGHDTFAKEDDSKQSLGEIFGDYFKLIRDVKPLRWMLLAIAFFMCGNSLYGSGVFYAYTYLMGFDEGMIAIAGIYGAVFGLVGPVVLDFFVKKFDKKQVLIVLLAISTASLFAFRFIGLDSVVKGFVYLTLYSFSNFGFWGLFWSFVYDNCEIDYLFNGRTRQGAMTSVSSMIQKFGSAIAMYLIGIILDANGYDGMAEVQTEAAMKGILDVVTIWPAIFTGAALLFLVLYPLNAKKFAKVQEAIKEKEETGKFSKEGLERLY